LDTFADLPDALVRDLLAKASTVADNVAKNLEKLRSERSILKDQADKAGLLRRKADLEVTREPSVVAIDGSYQIHHLTAIDLCAAAAVAVEGTSREAKRLWPQPFHEMWVDSLKHEIDTVGALRGMMVSMELKLAEQAPHDIVLLDGSFSSVIIYLNQALVNLSTCAPPLCTELLKRWHAGMLSSVIALLRSDRTVAIPKFTSRNELANHGINASIDVDGKTLATLILQPGEYTRPLPILSKEETYHLPEHVFVGKLKIDLCTPQDIVEINHALHELRVIYFRPYGWLPSLRLELPGSIANSATRLSLILEGITRQFFSPAVIEPYPLFLADRMVKSLGSGVAVIEQAVAQQVAGDSIDLETSLLCLQNYRTVGGRGGV